MEEKVTCQKTCGHFGYDAKEVQKTWHGLWPKESMLNRVSKLPEMLKEFEKNKFRLTLDYDPEFERVLVQIDLNPCL